MKHPEVVLSSIIALFFMVLTFLKDWLFIIPAVIISIINWKILTKKK